MLEHLFHNTDILTFDACKREFNLHSREHYHYLQLRHWALTPAVREAATRGKTEFEQYVPTVQSMKGVISSLYKYLLSTLRSGRPRYMGMWEEITQREISEREWAALWADIHKFNHSLELRDAHLKT